MQQLQATAAALVAALEAAVTAPYYADEAVTLYLGDCREVTDWLAADVLVTDPPYGIGHVTGFGGSRPSTREPQSIVNDEDFSCAQEAITLAASMPMAICANHASLERTLAAVRAAHKRTRVMTWWKTNVNGSTPGNPWLADVEFLALGVPVWPNRAVSAVVPSPRSTGNPQWQKRNAEAFLHPMQKPVRVMAAAIEALSASGVIADPFAGSGSTLVAARNLGRHAVGVELDERYAERTARRLSQGVLVA
jgi:site-specific DNA-methyltransferase (adenine-specific)